MSFLQLSRDEMCKAMSELDQALFHHDEWYEGLNRTLICGLPPDQRDVEENAHQNCRFGQWLYCSGGRSLAAHPAMAEIEVLHKRMHQCARSLLVASADGRPTRLEDYERLVIVLKQMRLEIVTTRHELEDGIYSLDPLTNASSRVGMLTKLREQQALVDRKLQDCSLAMMDIDFFKTINDNYGHPAGDGVLSTLAQEVKKQIRPYDQFYRYGGEEFLICMPSLAIESARPMLDRLRESIAAINFEGEDHKPFHITVSIGLTRLEAGVPIEKMIEHADKALYAAKSAGRNRVAVWEVSMLDC